MGGALALVSLLAAQASVWVDGAATSTLAKAFNDHLGDELPSGSISLDRREATLAALLTDAGGVLRLEVRDQRGELLIERSIDTTAGIMPALRVAVLLVRGALEAAPRVPPREETVLEDTVRADSGRSDTAPIETGTIARIAEVAAQPDVSRPLQLEVTIAAAHVPWKPQPFQPAPGIALSVHARFGPVLAGATGIYRAGTNESADVTGDVKDRIITGDLGVGLPSLGIERLRLDVLVSLGVDVASVDAKSRIYAGPIQPFKMNHFIAFGAVRAGVDLAFGVALDARLGVRLAPSSEVAIPDVPMSNHDPLETGEIAPFGWLGLTYTLR